MKFRKTSKEQREANLEDDDNTGEVEFSMVMFSAMKASPSTLVLPHPRSPCRSHEMTKRELDE